MSNYVMIIIIIIIIPLNDIIDILWVTHGYRTITSPDGYFCKADGFVQCNWKLINSMWSNVSRHSHPSNSYNDQAASEPIWNYLHKSDDDALKCEFTKKYFE